MCPDYYLVALVGAGLSAVHSLLRGRGPSGEVGVESANVKVFVQIFAELGEANNAPLLVISW